MLNSTKLRQALVEEARSWVGTKFHHQGRLKKSLNSKGGCDCLGLFIGVSEKLKLKDKHGVFIKQLDEINYPKVPDGEYLHKKLSYHFNEVDITQVKVGDLLLFNFAKHPQHLGFVCDRNYDVQKILTIIHAYSPSGQVCEHILDNKWRSRIVSAYSLIQS